MIHYNFFLASSLANTSDTWLTGLLGRDFVTIIAVHKSLVYIHVHVVPAWMFHSLAPSPRVGATPKLVGKSLYHLCMAIVRRRPA